VAGGGVLQNESCITNASIEVSVKETNHSVADLESSFSNGSVGVGCSIAGIARSLIIELSQRLVYTMDFPPIT
jgi:hypothetical protein